jgi:hypothetical protein
MAVTACNVWLCRADGDSDDAEHWLLPTEALDAPVSFQKRPVAAPRGM